MTARLISDLSEDLYHADEIGEDAPSASSSALRTLLAKTPLHAKGEHPKLTDTPTSKQSTPMDIGTAVHAALLQGKDVVVPVDHTDFRTKAARDERDAARNYGMIPMKRADYERTLEIVDAVNAQIGAFADTPPLLVDGKAEQTIVYTDRGVLCRVRIDHLRNDFTVAEDIKTEGRSANPLDWERKTMFERAYHVQAAMYVRGVEALTGTKPEFRFIVVESVAPHAVAVFSPSARAYELADEQLDYALDTWAKCLSTGHWPGYAQRTYYISPPAYIESAWLDYQYLEEAAA